MEILSISVAELIQLARKSNADILRFSIADGDISHIRVYVINGVKECEEIEEAIAAVEKSWDTETIAS